MIVMFTRRDDTYMVKFNYSAAIVAVIKSTVPAYARSFAPASKTWTVDGDWAPILAAALRATGYQVVGIDDPRCHHGRRDTDPSRWAQLLFRRVGPHRSPAVYRALSRCLHPDVGGDTELQRELNTAYHELPNRRKTA
jgi:hypothetical protein